jgi:peptide/nickel transport system permease protein
VIRFVASRLASMVGVLFALSVLVFVIFFAMPGIDPARQLAGRNPSPATLAAIRESFGLDRPLPVQYLRMMDQLVIQRDLESYTHRGVPVIPEIVKAVPVTMSLIVGAALLWLVTSIVIGVASAVLRNTVWDRAMMLFSLLAVSIPVFWLGQVANLITQNRFHDFILFSWIPPLGYTPLVEDPLTWFRGLVVPWVVLATTFTGLYARILRSSMIETGNQDFIRTARSKGVSELRVVLRHQLRSSLTTVVSLFALDFGVLVGGGALLVEVVFGLPGVGRLTYQSLAGLDLPVIMAAVLYGGAFIVMMNAVVDIAYARLDPRVRVD